MIRKATEDDILALTDFFNAHIETSMFLLSNLLAHGIGNTDHSHGTTYFLRETGDGIAAVLGATNGGMLMCQMPGLSKIEAEAWAYALQGYTLHGMTGHAEQVALFLDALPIPEEAWQINADQPLFALDLDTLEPGQAATRPVTEADRSLLAQWMPHHLVDSGLASDPPDAKAVENRIDATIASGTYVLLTEDGTAVALTGLNARAGRAVQIGGVFVPRDLRGAGRAGRVVAAHLASLRAEGIDRAILFAASDAAAKAYTKIGFQRIGAYRIALLRAPLALGAPT